MFFGSLSLTAQTIVIKDEVTLQAIEGAHVYSGDTKINAYTDANGRASLTGASPAANVMVSAVGYETRQLALSEITGGNSTVLLTQTRITLDEVVVSANRWEQNSREVPVRITAITSKEIALQNPQTAADLIGLSGEASIQKSQLGGGSPIIRGFAANRVVLVDESKGFGGVSAMVSHLIQDKAFDYLDAPIKRVTTLDAPAIYSQHIEDEQLPNPRRIVEKVLALG